MRLVIFGDPHSALSLELIAASLREARARVGIEIVAVCDAGRVAPPGARDIGQELVQSFAMRVFGEHASFAPAFRRARGLRTPQGTPVIVPPARDVNHPEFVALVRRELQPDAALSLGCMQIFGDELLAVLRRPANFHTSLLPAYRGLQSTAWSLYQGEPVTGFSYHMMEEGIDTGAVFAQGSIPIRPGVRLRELELGKTAFAVELLPEVLDALVRGDPGRPQTGVPSYFGLRDFLAVTSVSDPGTLTWEELERRLRAFAVLTISIDGEPYSVTRLRRIGDDRPSHPKLAFTTLDGVLAEPSRCGYLPVPLHRAYRRARRRRAR